MTQPRGPGIPKPSAAPAGHCWERSPVEGAQILGAEDQRKCSVYRGPTSTRRSSCNAKAVALSGGHPRCAEHLRQCGIWIDMGVAFEWALAPKEEDA